MRTRDQQRGGDDGTGHHRQADDPGQPRANESRPAPRREQAGVIAAAADDVSAGELITGFGHDLLHFAL
jgi:hypothetical protein